MPEGRSDDAIRADLAAIASLDWLSKGDDGKVHRLAADVAPLLARAVAAEARAETAEADAELLRAADGDFRELDRQWSRRYRSDLASLNRAWKERDEASAYLDEARARVAAVGAAHREQHPTCTLVVDGRVQPGPICGVGMALAAASPQPEPKDAPTKEAKPCADCGHPSSVHHKLHCEAADVNCYDCNGWRCPEHGLVLCGCTYLGGPAASPIPPPEGQR